MTWKYSLTRLFGILAYFIISTAAKESLAGDHLAKDNEFLYHVSLQIVEHRHSCGGGIIDDKFILTAAHCVVNNFNEFYGEHITVLAGTNDLRKHDKPAVIGHVVKIYVPKKFHSQDSNRFSEIADIAVLKLKDSLHVWLHKNLKKLKLPSNDQDHNENYAGKTAIIAAFGQYLTDDEPHKIKVSEHLRYSEADVLTTRQCQNGYGQQRINAKLQICARVKQHNETTIRGTCSGDSGSPLIIDGNMAIGILSLGPAGCNERIRAGIYTRVTSYLDFIRNAMKDKKTDDIRTHELKL